MKTRQEYETLFSKYPDVVTLTQFRTMLGSIAEVTARKFLQEQNIRHFRIHRQYYIPKIYVIDFVIGDYYQTHKKYLKAKI